MKRKTLTLTLSILACLALIGVGFASWIISADTSTNATGSFIVDTVTDNRLVVENGRWITINGTEVTSSLMVVFLKITLFNSSQEKLILSYKNGVSKR